MTVKLLLRPKWQDGESWCGYLLRLADLNAIPGFAQLASKGGMTYASLSLGQPKWVLSRLGVVHPSVPAIAMPQGTHGRTDQLSKYLRPQYTTVCPDCLRSDDVPFLRAKWDLPLEVTCHIHSVRLMATCPRCDAQVQTRRGKFLHCKCGMPFRDWRAQKDELSTEHVRKILALTLAPASELTFQTADRRELAALVVLRSIAYSDGLQIKGTGRSLPRLLSPADRYSIIARSAAWFEDWPRAFKGKLLRSGWDPCMEGIDRLDRHALRVPTFPRLVQVWDGLVNDRRSARSAAERERSAKVHPDRMTLQEVKLALELTTGRFSAWAKAGVFGDLKYEQKGSISRVFVDRNVVERLQLLLRQTISFEEACGCLETSERVIHVLLQSAILKEHRFGKETPTARMWREDLTHFSSSLCGIAIRAHSTEGMRPITKVITNLFKASGPELVARFVFELLAQSLPLYRQRSAKEKLINLYVSYSELRWFCRRVRHDNAVSA